MRNDREDWKAKLPLIKAFAEGRSVSLNIRGNVWEKLTCAATFCCDASQYRIDPEPIERWVNVYPSRTSGGMETREVADACSTSDRIAVVRLVEVERIEV